MNASIVNIGDELLIGQVVNTNATYMSQALTHSGIAVVEVCTVGDNADAIESAIRRCLEHSDLILLTGGLGPTKDDITKETLCRFFGSELYENTEALANIERLFAQRGFPLTETNRRQALVPRCCEMINNDHGTAPCMWFNAGKKAIVSLPGVPFEMEYLIAEKIIPLIRERFNIGSIVCRNILVQGIGESFLSDLLEDIEAAMPKNTKLAYLPQAGIIKLRITAIGEGASSQEEIEKQVEDVASAVSKAARQYIVGENVESIAEAVSNMMHSRRCTLATAESCTGGHIAAMLTALPGASEYFKGGITAYCNEAKHKLLGVAQHTLDTYGAVSEQTVSEMVQGARTKYNADYAVATTGVAGPAGGTEATPVGTVWMAVATPTHTVTMKKHYNGRRQQVTDRATNEVLAMLIRECENLPPNA